MKTTIRTIILSAAVIFAAMSCQKEESVPGTQDKVNAGETIQVSINASLGDLVAADGAKATAESVVRLTWDGLEIVQAYCGTDKISEEGLTVTPSENGLSAKLSGTITAPEEGKTITFVFSSGCQANGLEFDFSTQTETDGIPFVAYATPVYDGTATLTEKMVGFKFATSVMKIAATNLGGGEISAVAIKGINTKVTLTPYDNSETCGIAGSEPASISTENFNSSSDGTRAIVTVGLVPDNASNPYRTLTIGQTDYTNKGVITSVKIESSTSYTTPASLFTCGTLNSHDYVLIAGTKWATQNLAITDSGNKKWKRGQTEAVKVPGTNKDVIVGDYFQWAAFRNYSSTSQSQDQGLLLYTSFTNTKCGGDNDKFSTDNGDFSKSFDVPNAPYGDTSNPYEPSYSKYSGSINLEKADDVASINLGGDWRMPTSAEFKALKEATYWKWDDTDLGYYVYAPKDGDAGKVNDGTGSYTQTDALLFFPAAGFGYNTSLSDAGSCGYYWSSSLYSNDITYAHCLYFHSDNVSQGHSYARCSGVSVRPVSD